MKLLSNIYLSAANIYLVELGSIMETKERWIKWFYDYGPMGLFIIALIESSVFPIPPDFVLILLAYDAPEKSFYYATICTIGSVSGAVFGWLIGRYGGEPVIRRFTSPEKFERAKTLLRKYDVLAVLIAGFTPIPYKVFTITTGIIRMNLIKMLIVSVFGRGGRFFLVATFFYYLGPDAKEWIEDNFAALTMGIGIGIILAFLIFMYFKKWRKVKVVK